MTDVNRLKEVLRDEGLTYDYLSRLLGMDRTTFYRRLERGGVFTTEEVSLIVDELNLPFLESMSIFFPNIVAKMQEEVK